MLEKTGDVNAPMDPGANNIVARDTGHQGIPGACEMMKIPATKIVRIAKTQEIEARGSGPRKDVIGVREKVERWVRRRRSKKVHPRRSMRGLTEAGSNPSTMMGLRQALILMYEEKSCEKTIGEGKLIRSQPWTRRKGSEIPMPP